MIDDERARPVADWRRSLGEHKNLAAELIDGGLKTVGGGCFAEDGFPTPEAATPAVFAFLMAVANELNGWCSVLDFDACTGRRG